MTPMLERDIQRNILLQFGREPDATIWRNNTGKLFEEWITHEHLRRMISLVTAGDAQGMIKLAGALLSAKRRVVQFGLCEGSSDIIGVVAAHGHGVFLAAEVKRVGKQPTKGQQQFLNIVNNRGGVAGCVHSTEEFQLLLDKARSL